MKLFLLTLLFSMYGLNLYSQDCGTFHLFNFKDTLIDDWVWDEPRKGFYFDMSYDELTGDNTGYISFALVDLQGDTLTDTEYYRWSYFFPFEAGDTNRYKMVYKEGVTSLPINFEGYLVTHNPECSIPISFVTSEVIESLNDEELELFPNPSDEYLSIRSNKVIQRIEILDVNGIKQLSVVNYNSIDIRNLMSGIYIIKLTYHDNSQRFRKFIKR